MLCWPVTGSAQIGGNNVQVAARVVSFLTPAPSGTVVAAIIFQPGNAASEAEAAAIERRIGAGLAAGRAVLKARLVPATDLNDLVGARIAFVTKGLGSIYDDIAAISARHSILTITGDRSCVAAGHCMVAITSAPKVEISVSRSATRAGQLQFTSAFLMLVKEL